MMPKKVLIVQPSKLLLPDELAKLRLNMISQLADGGKVVVIPYDVLYEVVEVDAVKVTDELLRLAEKYKKET